MSRWSRDLGAVRAEDIEAAAAALHVEPTADELSLAKMEAEGKVAGDYGRRSVQAKRDANAELDDQTVKVAAAMAKAGAEVLGGGDDVFIHMYGACRLDGESISGNFGAKLIVATVTLTKVVRVP